MKNRYFASFASLFVALGFVTVASRPSKNVTLPNVRQVDGSATRRVQPWILKKEDSPKISSTSYFFKRATHTFANRSPPLQQKQIFANTKFTNARDLDKKSKTKRTLCSCGETSCCEEDCTAECSDPCPCPTPSPTSSIHLFLVPTRPPQRPVVISQSNTPPVGQPLINNVPANTGTIGLHPGIPGGAGTVNTIGLHPVIPGGTGTANTIGLHPGIPGGTGTLNTYNPPQESPAQNFLLRIPQNQGQSMPNPNPNLVNPPNQGLISRNPFTNSNPNFNPNPVINVPINTNSVPTRYIVPYQQTTNGYPNTNQGNFGSYSNQPQNQPIYTNVGNQGLNYVNNQGQNYGNPGMNPNQRSGYINRALPNGIQGTNYIQGNGYSNQVANVQSNNYGSPGSNSNNPGTNSGTNQGPNTNVGPTDANQVGNPNESLGPNMTPLSIQFPSSLQPNSQNSGNSATQSNVNSGRPGNQAPGNVANQENNPYAPGNKLPTSVRNPSTNPAGPSNLGGSTNPQSGPQASSSSQVNNPFAPGGALSSNPSTNPVGSTNQAGATNAVGSNNPARPTNPSGSTNPQANNPLAPGGPLSPSNTNPSAKQPGSNKPAGSPNQHGSAHPVTDSSNPTGKPSPANNNSRKAQLADDRSSSENITQMPKNNQNSQSDETRNERKELTSNREQQKSHSSEGQQSESSNESEPNIKKQSSKSLSMANKNAQRGHLKKLMQELVDKLLEHGTAVSTKEMRESGLVRKKSSRKDDKNGVRSHAFAKRRKGKFSRQKSSKAAKKRIVPPKKAKVHGRKTSWKNVWEKFA